MKLTQLPPPPAQTVVPPPPVAPGPASRAGTPVPVPDALIAPDVKDFALMLTRFLAPALSAVVVDSGFLGLASEVSEVRRNRSRMRGEFYGG